MRGEPQRPGAMRLAHSLVYGSINGWLVLFHCLVISGEACRRSPQVSRWSQVSAGRLRHKVTRELSPP